MKPRRFVLVALVLLLLPAAAGAQPSPVASGSTNWDGVSLDVTHVERKGSVLTVKWAVRNSGGERATVQFQLTGSDVTTYLVDEENGTKYFALTDKEKNVLASEHEYTSSSFGINDDIKAGETKRYWAKFPAPPPEVKAITVMFTEAQPIEEAAITDK
jgi:hypothetical protein